MWRVLLDRDHRPIGELVDSLSSDERERAARFRFDAHRRAFVTGRATLRAILGRYCGEDPASVRLGVTDHGKPFLLDGGDVSFNLSHSGAVIVYAVAWRRRVGIDVERVRSDLDHDALSARFFAPEEQRALRRVPEAQRQAAFFACWVRKEAFVKGRGEGLSLGLDQFVVSVAPDQPPRLLAVRGRPGESEGWSLHALDAGAGYSAAVAVEGPVRQVRCRDWAGVGTA